MPNTLIENVERVKSSKTAIANAIIAKGGTINDGDGLEDFATAVETIPSGSIDDKAVRFYDYDGTLLHTYSVDDFMQLSSMPENPTHEGLTSQGWNWTLTDAQEYVNKFDCLDIGQMYITSDGKTRLYITLTDNRCEPFIDLYLSANSTVVVDWGDGSATSTLSTTSSSGHRTEQHVYPSGGDYVISLDVTAGSMTFTSNNTNLGSLISGNKKSGTSIDRFYINSLTKVEIGSGITTLGDRSFNVAQKLKSVSIPNTITSIGVYVFTFCYDVDFIVIPYGVTTISNNAFNQSSLKRISLPKSIESIGSQAFNLSQRLESLMFPNNTSFTTISESICYQCYNLETLVIPDNVTTLNTSAFYKCISLKSVKLPNSLVTLQNSVFNECSNLESIELPNSVTSIGSTCFQNCYTLKSAKISNKMTSTGSSTFYGCVALKDVTIPEGVTTISSGTFRDCLNLHEIKLPESLTTIGDQAFQKCQSLNNIEIPDSVTSIGTNAFNECVSLVSIDIPEFAIFDSSKTGQFGNCYSIESFTFNNNSTYISGSMFASNYALRKLLIPSTVTGIGNSAFSSCTGVDEIRFETITPPTLGGNSVFSNVPSTTMIYIPYEKSYDYLIGKYYPSANSYKYIAYGTFANGEELPVINTELNYSYTWYASVDDLVAETNPITVGNGSEIYAKLTLLTRVNRYTTAVAATSSSTELTNTATIECAVGDLVIASCAIPYSSSYSVTEEGWSILGVSDPSSTNDVRLIVFYKTAESTSETITVTIETASKINISIVAITGASIGTLTFGGRTGAEYTVEENKPNGIVLWGVYSRVWSTTSKKYWTCNETKEPYMTLSQDTNYPRLLVALDQSPNETEVFTGVSSDKTNDFIWYSLTITDIPNFWYYE